MLIKSILSCIYHTYVEPDLLKRTELSKLVARHQHLKTLEETKDTCFNITEFGRQKNKILGIKIKKLQKELSK